MPTAHWRNALHESMAFIRHSLKKQNAHDIHSPFVFDLVTKVLNDERAFGVFDRIESERRLFEANHSYVDFKDFGAGSRYAKNGKRKIGEIARSTLQPASHAQLLFRLVNFLQPKTILELGTSLGITASYLACANNKTKMISIEGAESVANLACALSEKLEIQNLKIFSGTFDQLLPLALEELKFIDFALIDGNHRYEPTIHYFETILHHASTDACLVFDDIHWSAEMEKAWLKIINHSHVTLSLDFFDFGIVFLNNRLAKEHFVLAIP